MATNKITVTNFNYNMQGTADFKVGPTLTRPASWNTGGFSGTCCMYANGYVYYIPQSAGYTGDITSILRCSVTDFEIAENWTAVATPAFEHVNEASSGSPFAHVTGTDTLLLRSGSNPASNKVIISTDNGATWNYTSANLPSAVTQHAICYGHGRVIVSNAYTSGSSYYTDNLGASWSSFSTGLPAASIYGLLAIPSHTNNWLLLVAGTNHIIYRNTSNGSGSWTSVYSFYMPSGSSEIFYYNGAVYFAAFPTSGSGYSEPFYIKSIDGGATWSSKIYCSRFRNILGSPRFSVWDKAFICSSKTNINSDGKGNGALYASNTDLRFTGYLDCPDQSGAISGDQLTPGDIYNPHYANKELIDLKDVDAIGVPFGIFTFSNPKIYYFNNLKMAQPGNSSYVEVTATSGSIEQVLQLPVRLADATEDVYTLQIYPSVLNLMATLDGFVYSAEYATAKVTATVWRNGVNVSSLFYFEKYSTTGLTTTISSNVVSVTALSNTYNSGTITINAIYNGISLSGTALVAKIPRDSMSGNQMGSSYSAFTATATSIYIKFKPNGQFQIKRGAGSYVDAGIWYNPINNTTYPGSSQYMTINYTSDTGDTLQAGTNGGIIGNTTGSLINVEREFYLSNAATGSHRVYLTLRLAPTSNMSAAVQGTGTLELVVP